MELNLGVFLCTRCAAAHRAVRVEDTRLVPLLEDISEADLTTLENLGNRVFNETFERFVPAQRARVTPASSHEARCEWVQLKYVDRSFMRRNQHQPSASSLSSFVGDDAPPSLAKTIPIRLVDYFLTFGRGAPTARRVGHELTDSVLDVVYEAKLTDRYPREDFRDTPLSPNIAMFCFPQDVDLVEGPAPPAPALFPFVLTKVDGAKQYAVCLRFYEKMDAVDVVRLTSDVERRQRTSSADVTPPTPEEEEERHRVRAQVWSTDIYTPVCICVVSHWPFFSLFSGFLTMLYRISLSAPPLPLERFISNFMNEVPLPPQGRVQVSFTIADQVLQILRPPPNKLPLLDVPLLTLFECLSHENVINAVLAIVSEQKVVFVADQYSILVHCIECLCSLIYPFYWQGVYMPLLPLKLCDFLYAPVPFIAGIHKSIEAQIDIPDDLVLVDLTENSVSVPSADTLPPLPDKDRRKLLGRLEKVAAVAPRAGVHNFLATDIAFPGNEHKIPVTNFATQAGIQVADSAPGTGSASRRPAPQTSMPPVTRGRSAAVNLGDLSAAASSLDVPASAAGANPPRLSRTSIAVDARHSSLYVAPERSVATPGGLEAPLPELRRNSFNPNGPIKGRARSRGGSALNIGVSVSTAALNMGAEPVVVGEFDPDEVRQAFLRIWEKVFLRYRQYFARVTPEEYRANGRPKSIFDWPRFLEECPDDQRPLLQAMSETQMVSTFLQERWTPDGQATPRDEYEVRFFDECIVAKQNRSISRFNKKETPFLDDTSLEIRGTFMAPPPDTSGLKAVRYQYEVFPHLDDKNFGVVRFVKPLVARSNTQRMQQTKQMQKVTSVLMVSPQAARHDWETTLQAVVRIQAVARGFAQRRHYVSSRRAIRFVTDRLHARHAARVRQAEFLEARDAAITLQAALRAKLEQRRVRLLESASVVLQAAMLAALQVRQRVVLRQSIIRVQQAWRTNVVGWRARREFLAMRRAVCTLQAAVHAAEAQRRVRERVRAVQTLQACLRANLMRRGFERTVNTGRWLMGRLRTLRARRLFLRTRSRVVKTQAVVRGLLTRLNVFSDLRKTITELRAKIVPLWTRLHVALVYRSQFWREFNDATFMNAAVHREELERLQAFEQLSAAEAKRHMQRAKSTLEAERGLLYMQLKHQTDSEFRTRVYSSFRIDPSGKKRKAQLLDALWNPSARDRVKAVVVSLLDGPDLHDAQPSDPVVALVAKFDRDWTANDIFSLGHLAAGSGHTPAMRSRLLSQVPPASRKRDHVLDPFPLESRSAAIVLELLTFKPNEDKKVIAAQVQAQAHLAGVALRKIERISHNVAQAVGSLVVSVAQAHDRERSLRDSLARAEFANHELRRRVSFARPASVSVLSAAPRPSFLQPSSVEFEYPPASRSPSVSANSTRALAVSLSQAPSIAGLRLGSRGNSGFGAPLIRLASTRGRGASRFVDQHIKGLDDVHDEEDLEMLEPRTGVELIEESS